MVVPQDEPPVLRAKAARAGSNARSGQRGLAGALRSVLASLERPLDRGCKGGRVIDPAELVEETTVIYVEVAVHEDVAQPNGCGEAPGERFGYDTDTRQRRQCLGVGLRSRPS